MIKLKKLGARLLQALACAAAMNATLGIIGVPLAVNKYYGLESYSLVPVVLLTMVVVWTVYHFAMKVIDWADEYCLFG